MRYTSDHDGKSKTASAVNQDHYPEQNEVENLRWDVEDLPTHDEIAQRAYELWKAHGCPEGSAAEDWFEAEEELRAGIESRDVIESTLGHAGSVQR